ncbi:Pectate lyase superfamily protein [uncultured Caudovirales phage]|uniref:Pectate lyase superfamily protein n=2 Tax=uncultured Caudovirales phage TaxID=2100421 RepID=A0A6J5SSB9_9CAUD|nr:Pectate lyase superfamily protein [uncultured Caudovirales phage]CAB4163590.1 Pectate lyase superfamily protein [uncultured Caudovirales phage]CAB4175997.1 Pectate lyase superfamily protein [uncultured Caudovirales phage]CAB4217664.1 Pectate lyase superfamily protein [uncultured Caudovirales phage]
MALTKVSYSMITGAVVNILDYGAIADYNENTPGSGTDNSAAIQAAVDAANAKSTNGAVYIPSGAYKILTAISVPYGVSIFGDGGTASVLHSEGCNGLNFTTFGYSIGSMFYEDFGLTAATGTNFAAVQSINSPTSVTQDGLNFNRVRFYGWNQCFVLSSTWNTTISTCRAENINNFVTLSQSNGQAVIVKIVNNNIVYAAGGRGTGNIYAINVLNTTGFTETVHIFQNSIYGFQICVNVDQATYITIGSNDLSASVKAIAFVTPAGGYNICNNYIEVSGSGTGIFGAAQGSETPETRTNIQNNYFIGTVTAAIGIQLNTAVATYQWNATVRDNTFFGFATNDILFYGSGKSLIDNNRCMSTGPTNSIFIGEVLGSPVILTNNYLRKALFIDVLADFTGGKLILLNNVESNSFQSTHQAAAPSTGTWRVGDIVYNNAPASAGYVGFVCTVAGTPGTWKSFGLIA